ncbi:MAG: US12 family protein [Candidatus Eisenbacteria bacterium]|uniref:US12 family protein n=1 Tax=Eiseniibacteriota bacterium TaxID=2212470 RepID=A0A956RQG6_UNCEI|nr:US12 family protein [Candidatus Eisenbacteria bacterium]
MPTAFPTVAELESSRRASFIRRTYAHLLAAVGLFVLIEWWLFQTGHALTIARAMLSVNWLLVLGGFAIVAWLARGMAQRAGSPAVQYAALFGFVLAEALLFVPLLVVANLQFPGAIQSAGVLTGIAFVGLTGIVFTTGRDFGFLGKFLALAGIGALLMIVAAVLFGFELGTWFSIVMVIVACGAILRDTSNVIHRYPENAHVSAALELFASFALLLWYVLRLFMRRR